MSRLLFSKTGDAVWISHLDLMRLFQRAFKRADLPLTHTQGFNPRPSVSIALPLSVGVESTCEILDFDLDGKTEESDLILARLNQCLIPNVQVAAVYDNGRKLKELTYLHSLVTLEYDEGIPTDAQTLLEELFASESLLVLKKGKNGIQEQDIIPLIRELKVVTANEREIVLDCIVCCQNPSLNPMQLPAAIERYRPELKPDFVKCCRVEIFDANMNIFR